MNNINFRSNAMNCVALAKELISKNELSYARHACLELRMAIEYIVYDNLKSYLSELPDDVIKKWTPKEIISEMKTADCFADQTTTYYIGEEHSFGVPPPPEEMKFLGQDRRFSMKWANTNHNALGNFLHVQTLHQLENNKEIDFNKINEKIKIILKECEYILNGNLFGSNFGSFYEFTCSECGGKIKKRFDKFNDNTEVTCRNSNCRALYIFNNTNKTLYLKKTYKYECYNCKKINEVADYKISINNKLKCVYCDKKIIIIYSIKPLNEYNDVSNNTQ